MPRVCGKDDGVDSPFVTQCHHCCSPIQVIRRPRNQKRFFFRSWRFWLQNYKNIFQTQIDVRAQVLSNRSLVLPYSMSLLVVFVSLIFLMICHNKLSVMQAIRLRIARPVCDGCTSLPRLSAAWRVEAFSFSAVFFFVMFHFILVDATPCLNTCLVFVKTNPVQPSVGTATYFLQISFRLGTCQSMLTQTERSNEPVPVCHRVSPFSPAICWSTRRTHSALARTA